MGRRTLDKDAIPLIAERFRVLAEPARLHLLCVLMAGGEHTVNHLVAETGLQQANVSKHLAVLHGHAFVRRRKDGLHVFYALADREVVLICDLMSRR